MELMSLVETMAGQFHDLDASPAGVLCFPRLSFPCACIFTGDRAAESDL